MDEILSEHQKTICHDNDDRIEIRYIPLPPEKRAAWNHSMKLLTRLLIEIINEQEKDLPQAEIAIEPGERQE